MVSHFLCIGSLDTTIEIFNCQVNKTCSVLKLNGHSQGILNDLKFMQYKHTY